MKKNKIELLAPAGTFESLVAAIQNGADAVYLAGTHFGARTNAGNFDDEELVKAVKYAHMRNVQIYVTVNTLINDSEIDDCLEYIRFLYNNDVDAVILQDYGVATLVNKIFQNLETHASTQMSIANTLDAKFAKEMGFKRIVLARENSLSEIKAIKENTDVEIEAFVHGALCVSYSGKCLFSFVNGGRSGNKGSCAQPCRMKYSLSKNNSRKLIDSRYLISMKDLSTITQIKEILSSDSVDSLKIEGRMKRPEYVATVVKNYRKAVDSMLKNEISDVELSKLEDEIKYVFNREYTKGHILEEISKDVVNFDIPKNKGVYLGEVIQVNNRQKRITLKLEDDLKKGDGLSLGEHVGRIISGKNIKSEASKGEIIELDYVGQSEVGTKVYKTYNKEIMDNALDSLKKEHCKFPIDCKLILKKDQSPELFIKDFDGNSVHYIDSEHTIELALNKPSSEESIEKQIAKLESTVFYLNNLEIEKDENIIIPLSILNKLRREALALIENKRYSKNKRELFDAKTVKNLIEKELQVFRDISIDETQNKSGLAVRCFDKEQYRACLELGIKTIYTSDIDLYKIISSDSKCEVYYMTPSIMKDSDIKSLDSFILEYKPNVITSSLGFGQKLKEMYIELNITSKINIDYMANLNNKFAIEYAIENFKEVLGTVNPGLEYTMNQENLDYVFSNENKHYTEILLASHPLLMITEYCPYKSDDKKCTKETCNINNASLTAETGEDNILKRELNCKVCIYSKKMLELHKDSVKMLKSKGYTKFRIDLLDEDYEKTKELIRKYTIK